MAKPKVTDEERAYIRTLKNADALTAAIIELVDEEGLTDGVLLVAAAKIVAQVIGARAEGDQSKLKDHMDPWIRGLAHEVSKSMAFHASVKDSERTKQ